MDQVGRVLTLGGGSRLVGMRQGSHFLASQRLGRLFQCRLVVFWVLYSRADMPAMVSLGGLTWLAQVITVSLTH